MDFTVCVPLYTISSHEIYMRKIAKETCPMSSRMRAGEIITFQKHHSLMIANYHQSLLYLCYSVYCYTCSHHSY